MTNLELCARQMMKCDAPLFNLLCSYWMQHRGRCNGCPLRYRCDREPMMTDQEMETWLKEKAK